jgi:hypothetical protein
VIADGQRVGRFTGRAPNILSDCDGRCWAVYRYDDFRVRLYVADDTGLPLSLRPIREEPSLEALLRYLEVLPEEPTTRVIPRPPPLTPYQQGRLDMLNEVKRALDGLTV